MVRAVPLRQKARSNISPARGSNTLALLRADRRIEHVDDERAMGNNIILTLRQGWTFTTGEDNRVDGAETPSEALQRLRSARPFDGPYTR